LLFLCSTASPFPPVPFHTAPVEDHAMSAAPPSFQAFFDTVRLWLANAREAEVQEIARLVLGEHERRLGAEDEPSPATQVTP